MGHGGPSHPTDERLLRFLVSGRHWKLERQTKTSNFTDTRLETSSGYSGFWSDDIVVWQLVPRPLFKKLLIILDRFKTLWRLLDTTAQRISASKRSTSQYRKVNRCSSRYLSYHIITLSVHPSMLGCLVSGPWCQHHSSQKAVRCRNGSRCNLLSCLPLKTDNTKYAALIFMLILRPHRSFLLLRNPIQSLANRFL